MHSASVILFAVIIGAFGVSSAFGERCKIPPEAPKRIAEVITSCEDEIKIQIIAEALLALDSTATGVKQRSKRAAPFSEEDRRIAGCLLQCVYKKLGAVDEHNIPTIEGLVRFYTGGSRDRGYVLATLKAVNICLNKVQRKYLGIPLSLQEEVGTCDLAYDTFECVSDQIGEYCGATP